MTTQPTTPGPRGCHGTNKAGNPCGTAAIRGTDYCGVHTEGHPVAIRFAPGSGHEVGPGRPSKWDVWRQEVLAEFHVYMRPYREAIIGAMMTATFEGQVHVSNVPDYGARVAIAEKLFNRLWGMPGQKVETTATLHATVDLSGLSLDEKRMVRAALTKVITLPPPESEAAA